MLSQYGNQPELEVQYSNAVLLIRIPPFSMRGSEAKEAESVYDNVKADTPSGSEDSEDDDDRW